MSGTRLLGPAARRRLLRIGIAVLAMAVAVVLLDRARARSGESPWFVAALAMDTPIPAEADVFRLRPGDLAASITAEPRPGAARRTLAGFRSLRAFPGAPPRIPHSVTAEEFRTMTCNSCHEAGGYSRRFSAYAPVTPHPEYRNCLQCHAADAGAVEMALPAGAAALRSGAGASVSAFATLDWQTSDWPRTDQRAMDGSPPVIPHDLHLRGNCLACHAGPSAVAEIRTTHPDRANCRQCHVPAYPTEDHGIFERPVAGTANSAGGAR
jgi:nitrate reductase (cytochrome), electron transfer subunit